MAGYSQLKASTCLVAVNIMLFNHILSSLTKPDPCLIESNCTNLVPDKPLLKNKKTKLVYGYFSLISLIKTNRYFYQFSRFFQNILHFRAFTAVNERHVLSVFFYAGISKFPSLVLNLLSRIHYTTQSATICK